MSALPEKELTVRERLLLFFVARWVKWQEMNNDALLYVDGQTLENINRAHPLSGLRVARMLRDEGLIGLENVDRLHSRYKITNVDLGKAREEFARRRRTEDGGPKVDENHIGGAYELYE